MTERISSIFFETLTNEIEYTPDALHALDGQYRDWSKAYFGRNIRTAIEVDGLQNEIELLLSKLGVESESAAGPVLSIEALIIGLKFYLISWSTMKDLMAMLINSVLDLGIAEKDMSFGMILRNDKVKKTKVPEICKKHAARLKIGHIDRARNDAVHRGKLTDPEVIELRTKRNAISSKRFSLLVSQTDKISADEYEEKMGEFYDELSKIVVKKKTEYLKHYEETVALNKELVEELAKIAANLLNNAGI